ncbi:MAG: hypothetical protein EB053_01010 [Chlamydiae bacterium]|nr:hypothetical protein [Chlamydiota bacterium]
MGGNMSACVTNVPYVQHEPIVPNDCGLGSEALKTAKKVGLVFAKIIVVIAHLCLHVLNFLFGVQRPDEVDEVFEPAYNRIQNLWPKD